MRNRCDVPVREGLRVDAEPTPATASCETWRSLPRGKRYRLWVFEHRGHRTTLSPPWVIGAGAAERVGGPVMTAEQHQRSSTVPGSCGEQPRRANEPTAQAS